MSIRFPILALIFFSCAAFAQSDYDNRTLEVKRMFSQRAMQALNEPFVGVTSDGSVEPGLFSIRASGVSTTPVMQALVDEQKVSATLAPTKVRNNNQGEANKDNLVLKYEGIPVMQFSTTGFTVRSF